MKKILTILLVSWLILTSCWTKEQVVVEKPTPKNATVDIVSKWEFTEEIKLPWKIIPFSETTINPLASWVINWIKVKIGDYVKAWQLLATIDLSNTAYWVSYDNAQKTLQNTQTSYYYTEESITKDLESAKIQLDNAKISKINTYSTTEKQLTLAQTQLDNILTSKWNLVKTTQESLKNAQLLLDNAKTNLENYNKNSQIQLKTLYDQEDSTYDDIKNSIDSAIINIDSTLNQVDLILWVTDANKNENDYYETYLWAKNTTSKTIAENYFRDANSQFEKFKTAKNYSSKAKIKETLNKTIDLSSKIADLCDTMIIVLDNSITWWSFSQSQLDSLRYNALWTWIASKQTTNNTIKSGLISAKNWIIKLENTISSTKTWIDTNTISLQNAINIAQTQYDNIKAWNDSQLDSINWNENLTKNQLENTISSIKQSRDAVDNALKIAEASYNSTLAKLNSQRAQTKSQLDNAKWWKDLAKIQLNNTNIVAPFDWIITAKNIEIWTSVSQQTPAFTISDSILLKTKLDLNSENASNLQVNSTAKIKKWENTYTWIISLVSPTPDSNTRLYKTEVTIIWNKQWLNIGDYVDVYKEISQSKERIISIPLSSFISFWEWKYWVYIVNKDNTVTLSYITLGRKNNTKVEVLNWLQEWQKYVKIWALNINEWDTINPIK